MERKAFFGFMVWVDELRGMECDVVLLVRRLQADEDETNFWRSKAGRLRGFELRFRPVFIRMEGGIVCIELMKIERAVCST